MAVPSIQPSLGLWIKPTMNDTMAAAMRIMRMGSWKDSKNSAQKPAKGGSGKMLGPYLQARNHNHTHTHPRVHTQSSVGEQAGALSQDAEPQLAEGAHDNDNDNDNVRLNSLNGVVWIDAHLRIAAQLQRKPGYATQTLQQRLALGGNTLHVQLA